MIVIIEYPPNRHHTSKIHPNVGLMLYQRHRRWTNIVPALGVLAFEPLRPEVVSQFVQQIRHVKST